MKAERNLAILTDRNSGMKYKELSIKYSITTERIRQILAGFNVPRKRSYHRSGDGDDFDIL